MEINLDVPEWFLYFVAAYLAAKVFLYITELVLNRMIDKELLESAKNERKL